MFNLLRIPLITGNNIISNVCNNIYELQTVQIGWLVKHTLGINPLFKTYGGIGHIVLATTLTAIPLAIIAMPQILMGVLKGKESTNDE
jgi:hypothetical protein